MTLVDFDRWVRSILPLEELERIDISLNGIQIGPDHREIKKAAFAVDASLASFQKAAEWGADLLFVHHGLFWGSPLAIRGSHYDRIKWALDKNLSLYAVHLPLDQHPALGNNAGMASKLDLIKQEPFGSYKGVKIGIKGELPEAMTCNDVVNRLFGGFAGVNLLNFGPEKVKTIGICSGGATREVEQAVEEGLDLFLTGEPSHQNYHFCLEQGINVIAAGHYATETFGVQLMAQKIETDLNIETLYIDIPTGL